jgi:hypothetical protein
LSLLIIVLTLFIVSPVISQLTDSVRIPNSGSIVATVSPPVVVNPQLVIAASGSAVDIQAAINEIVNEGGIGDVLIPAGTFNFVEVGEAWRTVNIPAGINLIGATPQLDSDGQVVEWETILRMPYDVPGSWSSMPTWFRITGNGDPNEPSRFSNIKLVGYRSISQSSTTLHQGISIDSVINFRVDHCMFEHTCGGAVRTWGLQCNGVIDHCRLVNYYGHDNLVNYENGNIGYGVDSGRAFSGSEYEPDSEVLGKYTDYSIYIEDCYFSKWRHCISPGHGVHIVLRYSTIDQDFGHYSLDVHGLRDTGTNRWGTRASEIYENRLTNAEDMRCIFQNGGGSGVFFNNYIDSTYEDNSIVLYSEDYVSSATWHLKNYYMWSAQGPLNPPSSHNGDVFSADRNVEVYWSRQAGDPSDANYPNVYPSWSIAGYEPYTYPHPLTL